MNLVIDPILPLSIICVIGGVLLLLTIRIYWQVGESIGFWRRLILLALRIAGIALVVTLLLQPSRREVIQPPMQERVTLAGLDTSLSMKQRDAGGKTRFDAGKGMLQEAGLVNAAGVAANQQVMVFGFGEDARPVTESILNLTPKGRTTLINKSVNTMLETPGNDAAVNAIILLTDGHDFEMVNPVKTGMAARDRGAPIYAVALGQQGNARDVAVRITGYQPYCYAKQKAHIEATLRLIGCELEDVTVQLLRQGQVMQTRRVNTQQLAELPVDFEVSEPSVGQYEYEVRVLPLPNEADTNNNSAITYLNVIDQQIRVLLVEGDPYWDTTFLERSLMRDDKLDVDALIRYQADHVRAIRKTPDAGQLHVPETVDQLGAYDVVILGRNVDTVPEAGKPGLEGLLDQYVRERGGSVIFSRGSAFLSGSGTGLEPVAWSDTRREHAHIEATAEGRGISPFQVLNGGGGAMDELPDVIDERVPKDTAPLSSVVAVSSSRDDATQVAAIVHRRYGEGQVVSIGVDGLWHWSLNAKAESANPPFDRFWDQMILWVLAGRDMVPTRQYSFRPNSANIMMGDKVYFRLVLRQPDANLKAVPVTIYYGDAEAGRATLAPVAGSASRLTADYLPERTGRYRAVVKLPDGTTQESRFIVFTDNVEETEVATDTTYLSQLCQASGGRLLEPRELSKLVRELSQMKSDQTPRVLLQPAWDEAWIFDLAVLLFGADWFLRRRWGLC